MDFKLGLHNNWGKKSQHFQKNIFRAYITTYYIIHLKCHQIHAVCYSCKNMKLIKIDYLAYILSLLSLNSIIVRLAGLYFLLKIWNFDKCTKWWENEWVMWKTCFCVRITDTKCCSCLIWLKYKLASLLENCFPFVLHALQFNCCTFWYWCQKSSNLD